MAKIKRSDRNGWQIFVQSGESEIASHDDEARHGGNEHKTILLQNRFSKDNPIHSSCIQGPKRRANESAGSFYQAWCRLKRQPLGARIAGRPQKRLLIRVTVRSRPAAGKHLTWWRQCSLGWRQRDAELGRLVLNYHGPLRPRSRRQNRLQRVHTSCYKPLIAPQWEEY